MAAFDVAGERREDRIGVWVRRPDKGAGREDKIAAIGIRVKRWVTLHGIALNVDCDLSHFSGIVPCGVCEPRYGVTSLADLGRLARMAEVDAALRREFEPLFGANRDAETHVRPSGPVGRLDHAQNQSVASTENSSPGRRWRSRSGRRSSSSTASTRAPARAAAAGLDHPGHRLGRTGEHRLDRAVAPVAHPAFQAAFERRVLGPGAIADALHATADDDMTDALPSLIRTPRISLGARAAPAATATSDAANGCRAPAVPTRARPRPPG